MRAIFILAASTLVLSVASIAAAQPAVEATAGAEVGVEAGTEAGAEAGAEPAPAPVLGGAGESCRARGDCAAGLACVQQVCTDPNQGKSCGATSECGGTLRCIEQVCGGPTKGEAGADGEAGAEGADGADGDGGGIGNDLPVPYVKRPLTLPAMTLAPELGFDAATVGVNRFTATAFAIDIGAAFGIIDDLTVEVMPLSVQFGDPDLDYGAFRLAAIYRFLGTEVAEVGAKLRFSIDNEGILILNPGLPVRLHLGDIVRIDTGVSFDFMFPTQGGNAIVALGDLDHDPFPAASPWHGAFLQDAGVPVDVAFQIVDFFWAGLNTGFGIADFENAGDAIFVPLGFEVGGTVPGEQGPLVDITAGFQFPYFVFSGHPDTIWPDVWELGINAKGYIGL